MQKAPSGPGSAGFVLVFSRPSLGAHFQRLPLLVSQRKRGLSSASIRAREGELISLTSEGSGSAGGRQGCSHAHGRGARGRLRPTLWGAPPMPKAPLGFFSWINLTRCRLDHCGAPASGARSVPTVRSDYPWFAAGPLELRALCSLASPSFGRAQTWFPATSRARGSNRCFFGSITKREGEGRAVPGVGAAHIEPFIAPRERLPVQEGAPALT